MMYKEGTAILFRAQAEQLNHDCYHKELSEIGVSGSSLQVLAFNFINSDQLNEALNRPKDFCGIIFTSPRAVEAIAKCSTDACQGNLQRQWESHNHFAVGETTAAEVVSLLGLSCQGKNSGNAKMLAELIVKDAERISKPFLFPCSTISRETLPAILADAGIPLQCLQVYETVAHPLLQQNLDRYVAQEHMPSLSTFEGVRNAPGEGFPEYVVFFSPSGIAHALPLLRAMNAPLESIKFVAIGPTTAKALQVAGLNVHSIATDPNARALAAAMVASRK